MSELIKLENIVKSYDGKRKILDHLSLIVNKGECLAILGKSGAGKSTMLNLLGCLDADYEGTYSLNLGSSPICISDRKRNFLKSQNRAALFSFVFQDGALLNYLDTEENVLLPLRLAKRKPDMEMVNVLFDELGISELRHSFVGNLSGGEKQRVGIARALISDVPIILADEPTGSLDYANVIPVVKLLKDASKKRGKTVLVVTHNMDILNEFDRVVELKNGKIEPFSK